MTPVRLSRQAEADIHAIWDYLGIAKGSPAAARNVVEMVYGRLNLLAQHPMLGQSRDDLRQGVRSFSAGAYVILYYPMEDGIEVIGVVHAARDIESLFHGGER
jgi:toxin ParE1/3/4